MSQEIRGHCGAGNLFRINLQQSQDAKKCAGPLYRRANSRILDFLIKSVPVKGWMTTIVYTALQMANTQRHCIPKSLGDGQMQYIKIANVSLLTIKECLRAVTSSEFQFPVLADFHPALSVTPYWRIVCPQWISCLTWMEFSLG